MSIPLKVIAEKIGVSTSTVSKVINNKPGVSDEMRVKILEQLKIMNYKPKKNAGGLMVDDSVKVNLCVEANVGAQSDPFYSLVLDGLAYELQSHRYNLIYNIIMEDELSDEKFNEIFLNNNVYGNIVVGAAFSNDFLERVSRLSSATVLIDNKYNDTNSINTDNFGGASQAMQHLAELGHKKIAFLSGHIEHKSISERYQGYVMGLNMYSKGNDEILIKARELNIDAGYEAIMQLDDIDFTAVFCANDKLAIGVIKALTQRGYKIPSDISVIGFDDLEWSSHTEPALTTVKVFKRQLGIRGAELFINLIDKQHELPVDIKVGTKLIKRESTAPLKKE